MLSLLHIENIAVIERADIELGLGFNVLTGETGAGKTIIIDAINAILGDRISRDLIRTGADHSLVTALFSNINKKTIEYISELGFNTDEDGSFLIQREMFQDGRNVCRINGIPTQVSMLKQIGNSLVNIHGQHDGQQLLNEDNHVVYLDRFAKNADLISEYQLRLNRLVEIRSKIKSLIADDAQKSKRIETLTYQINEISKANLVDGEEERLTEKKNILINSEKISNAIETSYDLLYGSDDSQGVCSMLLDCERAFSSISNINEDFKNISSRVSELKFASDDLFLEIRAVKDSMDFSENELNDIEKRLDNIYKLKLKYGSSIKEILVYLEEISSELSEIEDSDNLIEKLKSEYKKQYEITLESARKISENRKKNALVLGQNIMGELSNLDMGKGQFIVKVTTNDADNIKFTKDGIDKVSFLISTNAGEPPKPLSKIASGGELSRIMLALKNALIKIDDVDTLIFDEIDTGVSGRAAQRIGEKLFDISRYKQIISITHLPQIAAMADNHFLIEKEESSGRSFTSVKNLTHERKVVAIASLISGEIITDASKNNATVLLELASAFKSNKGDSN